MSISLLATFVAEVMILVGVIVPVLVWIRKISNGTKCQLRNEMLHIYYRHCDTKEIRQYEYENFVFLYEAYKALGGNSFIDKIYEEIQTYKIKS